MIVLGTDTHKRSHTIAAVSAATGELLGELTVPVGAKGFAALVVWARQLGSERVWAIEDCRHVSASFERFLIQRGERVLRVPTKLMADSRRRARGRGKSDSIDALAVARAALREGLDVLPAAQLEGAELDLRLLVDHRERLVRQRVAINNTLQWHPHDIWPELRLPGSSLFYGNWGLRIARRLARAERRAFASPETSCAASRALAGHQGARGRDRSPRRPNHAAAALRARLWAADRGQARRRGRWRAAVRDRCQARPGRRRRSDSCQLRQYQPPPPGGNRQINATIHRIAITRSRCHPETQDYVARKRAEGKSTKEAYLHDVEDADCREAVLLESQPQISGSATDFQQCVAAGSIVGMWVCWLAILLFVLAPSTARADGTIAQAGTELRYVSDVRTLGLGDSKEFAAFECAPAATPCLQFSHGDQGIRAGVGCVQVANLATIAACSPNVASVRLTLNDGDDFVKVFEGVPPNDDGRR
jgi:hypothetical protein